MKKALIIVDLQNDFCPGGALATPKGDIIVPVINKILDKFEVVTASQDWHPEDSIHFDKWSPHCVQGTHGAELHPNIDQSKIDYFFLKGTYNLDDGYSAFEASNTDVVTYFRDRNIDELYIAGLAIEYCIKATALDAIKNSFKTYIIEDAIEGLRMNENDFENSKKELIEAGAIFIQSSEIN